MEENEIEELENKIAHLESENEQLRSEMKHVDMLMKLVGFSRGLDTIKATANEIINKGYNIYNFPE